MRKERERIAQRYRSDGESEKVRIESEAQRLAETILARAQAEAEKIRGAGEAEALSIRNEAYARDPEFFETLRALEAYEKLLTRDTVVVLSASGRLFRLLTEGVPTAPDKPAGNPPSAADAGPAASTAPRPALPAPVQGGGP
jgi:membrane protease subunit HflC